MFEFARWLGATPLSVAVQSSSWLTPLLQAVHILMIGVVFVSMLMIALRVLGLARNDETFDATWQRFAPWMWRALLIMLLTGLVLIIGEPSRQANALSFWLKLGLIVVAVFSVSGLRRALAGHTAGAFPTGPRVAAAAIILIWVLIIFLGRAIAYDTEVWGALHLGAPA
jgi:uncharacterized membrane protein SirB2